MKNAITAALENLSSTPSTPEETAAAVTTEEITTTGESVTEQTSANEVIGTSMDSVPKKPFEVEKNFPWLNCTELMEPDEDEAAGESATTQAPAQIDNTPTVAKLPKDYLANGYYAATDKGSKYLRSEFVGEYAETMAAMLSDMKPAAFNGLLREMKRSKKTALPFEARLTAAAEMLPKAMALVRRKKAPALLVSFIKDNLDHIQNDDDWYAYLRHLEAIAAYITAQQEEGQ